jgi:hypothetical protein
MFNAKRRELTQLNESPTSLRVIDGCVAPQIQLEKTTKKWKQEIGNQGKEKGEKATKESKTFS